MYGHVLNNDINNVQVANSKPLTDQVSILVRPSAGGNAVLLNVPRNVAIKVSGGG